MMRFFHMAFLIAGITLLAEQARADALTIDLAHNTVDITTGFTGAKLVLFGVKEKEGDLAVVVRGPEKRIVVRRKEQILGMWMNRKSVEFLDVPTYYDYAVSAPEQILADPEVLRGSRIGLDALSFTPVEAEDDTDVSAFHEALVWNKIARGLYPLEPGNVIYLNNSFFKVTFSIPANVPTGDYTVTAYLFQNGQISEIEQTDLKVAQTGFSADVNNFALQNGIVYGILSVMLAVVSAWSAHTFLRRD